MIREQTKTFAFNLSST